MRKSQFLAVILILVAASWLTTIVDDGLGLGWPFNVARNWERFGFFNLHGKLVCNPGGYQAETQPQIYAGHEAASLYPFFLTQRFFPWPGTAYLYYGLAAAVVLFCIWQLLGRTDRAFWLAGIAVLTPGYLRWQTSLDPNLVAVLAGFPFCVAAIHLLKCKQLSPVQIILLLLLIVLYSAVNWSTVFIQGMLFATLLLLREVPWKNLFIYLLLAAVSAGIIVATSVIDKMTHANSGSGIGFSELLEGYGWGNAGYGLDVSTKTDFLRLSFVNFIGLLPVIIFLGWEVWRGGRRRGSGEPGVFCLLPLLAAIFPLVLLRNYFGHHPWMSCNFVLQGMVLSFVAWKSIPPAADTTVKTEVKPVWLWTTLAAGCAYGFVVLLFYHIHNGQELNLVKLIRSHTARTATILITRDTDSALAEMNDRLPELFDRRVEVLTSISGNGGEMANKYWLTAVPEKRDGYQMIAGSNEKEDWSLFKQILGWYSRTIARRRPGDKMDMAAQYYLYQ